MKPCPMCKTNEISDSGPFLDTCHKCKFKISVTLLVSALSIIFIIANYKWDSPKLEKRKYDIETMLEQDKNEKSKFKSLTVEQHIAEYKRLKAISVKNMDKTEKYSARDHLQEIPNTNPVRIAGDAQILRDINLKEKRLLSEKRKEGVRIGMTPEDVRLSSWGRPNKINRSQYLGGPKKEQWVYSGGYLYFESGMLIGIQN